MVGLARTFLTFLFSGWSDALHCLPELRDGNCPMIECPNILTGHPRRDIAWEACAGSRLRRIGGLTMAASLCSENDDTWRNLKCRAMIKRQDCIPMRMLHAVSWRLLRPP